MFCKVFGVRKSQIKEKEHVSLTAMVECSKESEQYGRISNALTQVCRKEVNDVFP